MAQIDRELVCWLPIDGMRKTACGKRTMSSSPEVFICGPLTAAWVENVTCLQCIESMSVNDAKKLLCLHSSSKCEGCGVIIFR